MGDVDEARFGNIYAATSLNGPGTGLTAIEPRSALVPGAPGALYNDAGGLLASEPQLGAARGGTGADLSASTGGEPRVVAITDGAGALGPTYAQTGPALSAILQRDSTGSAHVGPAPGGASVAFVANHVGTPADITREYMSAGWSSTSGKFEIATHAAGFGTARTIAVNAPAIELSGGTVIGPPPTLPESLTTKSYVDTYAAGTVFIRSVLAFAAPPPVGPGDGDRYIASATGGGWTENYIYQWSAGGGVWLESIPTQGWVVYVEGGPTFPMRSVVYTIDGYWTSTCLSLDHNDLINRGTNTHAQIDSHVDATTTDPHAGQDLRAIASPTFASLTATTVAAPAAGPGLALVDAGPGSPAGTQIFFLRDDGVVRLDQAPGGPAGAGLSVEGSIATDTFVETVRVAPPAGAAGVRVGLAPTAPLAVATSLEVASASGDGIKIIRDTVAHDDTHAATLAIDGSDHLRITTLGGTGTEIRPALGVGGVSEAGVAMTAYSSTGPQLKMYYGLNKTATMTVGAAGILTIDAPESGQIASPALLTITNATPSVSSLSGAVIITGGLGVGESIHCQWLVANMRANSAPLAARWYRVFVPAISHGPFELDVSHLYYGKWTFWGYTVSGFGDMATYAVPVTGTIFRLLIARETSSGLARVYICGSYSPSVIIQLTPYAWDGADCGPASPAGGGADPNDMLPGDYTIVYDSATGPLAPSWLGPCSLVYPSGAQLELAYDRTFAQYARFTTDSSGYLTVNTSGNRVLIDVSDSLRVLATTASTSPATGALIVAGGAGFAEQVSSATSLANSIALLSPAFASTTSANAAAYQWYSAAYSPELNIFAAVSNSGGVADRAMSSADGGATWTLRATPNGNNWKAITYGAGTFVACSGNSVAAANDQVMYSYNGTTWAAATSPGAVSQAWRAVEYGGDSFVMVSQDNSATGAATSPDGVVWTLRSCVAGYWGALAYGRGRWVSVAYQGAVDRIMTSDDGGVSWTGRGLGAEANDWRAVGFGGGWFVAVSLTGTNRIMVSANGINWAAVAAPVAEGLRGVVYGDGLFCITTEQAAGGHNIVCRGDPSAAASWVAVSRPNGQYYHHAAYGRGRIVGPSQQVANPNCFIMDTQTGTAAAVVAADANVGGRLECGADLHVSGKAQFAGPAEVSDALWLTPRGTTRLWGDPQSGDIGIYSATGRVACGPQLAVADTTAAVSKTTGAVTIAGGLGVGGDVHATTYYGAFAGTITPTAPLTLTGTAIPQLTVAYDGTHAYSVSVDSTGTTTMNTTNELKFKSAYEDLLVAPALRAGGGTVPSLVNVNSSGLYLYRFQPGSNEELHFVAQMPHSWSEGSTINVHVHWAPSNTNTGNALWSITYVVQDSIGDTTIISAATTTTVSVPCAASGLAFAAQLDNLCNIGMVGKHASALVTGRLRRLGTDGADTFTGDAYLLAFDFHYLRDRPGTLTIP